MMLRDLLVCAAVAVFGMLSPLTQSLSAAEMPGVRVSEDRTHFELGTSQIPFTPWGFNYDHDETGRLIEDYWETEWPKVEADFAEMKSLGANVVRVHLQFGKFMESATQARTTSLQQLQRLLKLAEDQQLYLDVTGLGCYHKADVPNWYDELNEAERWASQAIFWSAIAETCSSSPAIFCYDLMNEPVVPGAGPKRSDWLGPAFAGKHFVQFITLELGQRQRSDVARSWIQQLSAAIRKHDQRHLITVGLVPWSLDRPGLTSGFVPSKIVADLDFIAVHVYPESKKLDEARETIAAFHVGKPVVVEETFPLKCSAKELGSVIDKADKASGWIGFYWGATPTELKAKNDIGAAITGSWLELFQSRATLRATNPAK